MRKADSGIIDIEVDGITIRAGRGADTGDDCVENKLADAIRYALSRWKGLTRFIDDGRVELDNNAVERSIRPITLNRKNALFAGSDGGAEHWAIIASLVETCKLNDVGTLACLTDPLTRIVNDRPK